MKLELDYRETQELSLAHAYVTVFNHYGTDGHNRLMLLDKLAKYIAQLEYENGVLKGEIVDNQNNGETSNIQLE